MAHQFVEGKFVECYEPTVESTYNKAVVVGKDELQLGDTAGQDKYTTLPHSFIIGIHGYVLVYLMTSLQRKGVRMKERGWQNHGGGIFLESSAKESQVTTGIFTKLIEEINQVDNSCGRSTSCRLM